MTYTGTLIDSLDSLVRAAIEKQSNALSGWQMFPMFLPCWHPAKAPFDSTLRMCGREP